MAIVFTIKREEMVNPIRKYFRKKRLSKLRQRYMSVGSCTIIQNPNCLDFRLPTEERKYVTIGDRCMVRGQFIFETPSGEVSIGNNCQIGEATFICRTRIDVGDDVTMAWGITLYDHDSHSTNWEYRKHDNEQCYKDYITTGNNIANKDWTHVKSAPIRIEDKVWIGMDVLILKGVTIGEGSVVAARSVVTKSIPPYSLVAGNPARVVKSLK